MTALTEAIEALGLSIRAEFIPFSRSRNAKPRDGEKEAWRSLNWRVTLELNGRDILTTDYSQGEGHAPASKIPSRWQNNKHIQRRALDIEIETGFQAIAETWSQGEPRQGRMAKHRIPSPSATDVIHSLVMDSDALDYGSFEDWAESLGYDSDSRSAETTYRACLEIALKLRASIGEPALATLREGASEY